jgi:hypothetical protein
VQMFSWMTSCVCSNFLSLPLKWYLYICTHYMLTCQDMHCMSYAAISDARWLHCNMYLT